MYVKIASKTLIFFIQNVRGRDIAGADEDTCCLDSIYVSPYIVYDDSYQKVAINFIKQKLFKI